MLTRRVILPVLAALLAQAAPATAGLLGDAVIIKRVQGESTVFKTVETVVGAGVEYSDTLFSVDVTDNEVIFAPTGGNFSLGTIVYTLEGLDFDDKPGTPNIITAFSTARIFGSAANPFDSRRATIGADGKLTLSLAQTTGAGSGFARVTLGAPTPAGVPEPASWAMMLGGFGLLGTAARRRPARANAMA